MLDLEVLELCLEAVSVRAGGHHADHHRSIVLKPAVAHHDIPMQPRSGSSAGLRRKYHSLKLTEDTTGTDRLFI